MSIQTPRSARSVHRARSQKPAAPSRFALRLLVAALLPVLVGSQFAPIAAGAGGAGAGGTGGAGSAPPYVPPTYPTDSIQPSTAPIKLPGGGGVSDSGAATYSMPVDVPDGPGGMQPALGVNYTGATDNGPLGVGFSLAGLSTIVPCRKTFASEGEADGVDFDRTDVFCLDGQKLVPRAEVDLRVGNADVVLGPETESFSRVVAHRANATDNQPNAFTVWLPNGNKATYAPVFGTRRRGLNGHQAPKYVNAINFLDTPDARDARVAIAYPIERVEDRLGNVVKFFYNVGYDVSGDDETSYRVGSIEYSYAPPSSVPRRKVVFNYNSRNDHIVRYLSGVKVVSRSRIASIDVYAPNPTTVAKVWSYQLGYEYGADTGRSRLISVKQLDQGGVESWARQFEWTNVSAGITDHVASGDPEFDKSSFSEDLDTIDKYESKWTDPNTGVLDWEYDHAWYFPTDVRIIPFDADGDGVDDVLYRTQSSNEDVAIYRSNHFERESHVGTIALRQSKDGGPLNTRTNVTPQLEGVYPIIFDNMPQWITHLGKSRVADFDGDGKLDLLMARTHLERDTEGAIAYDPYTNVPEDLELHHQWTFGYANLGSLNANSTWDPLPPIYPGFTHISVYGWSWVKKPFAWFSRYYLRFTPTFQIIVADIDGDGQVEQFDALPGMIDIMDNLDIDWNDLDPQTETYPYKTELSTEDDPPVYFPADVAGQKAARWTCGNGHAIVLDYEGDGRADVLVGDEADPDLYIPANGVFDRMHVEDAQIDLGTGGLVRAPVTSESSALWAGGCDEHSSDVVVGDWNGDGLDDFLYPPYSYWIDGDPDPYAFDLVENVEPVVRWNLGNGFGPAVPMPVNNAALSARMESPRPTGKYGDPVDWDRGTRAVDLNRDGRTDILAMRYADVNQRVGYGDKIVIAYISTGTGFAATQLGVWEGQTSRAEGFTTFQVGDFTGDGAPDFVSVNNDHIVTTEMRWRTPVDLLAKVKDSGSVYALEEFTYSGAWWGSGARPSPSSCGPNVDCVRTSFPVVRQHAVFAGTKPNGDPRYREMLHSYADPRRHRRGRGFLGFAEHRIWDRETGSETIRKFDNQTEVDPEPGRDGGEFFPFARTLVETRTTTPLELLPTDAELLTANPNFPGHTGDVVTTTVRTVRTVMHYQPVPDPTGRSVTKLATGWEETERDTTAIAVDVQQSVPHYSTWGSSAPNQVRMTESSTTFDDFGRALSTNTTIEGGTVARVNRQYDDPSIDGGDADTLPDWMFGRVRVTETRSYDEGNTNNDDLISRVVRTDYDDFGRITHQETTGRGRAFHQCLPPANCSLLELPGVVADATYDAASHGALKTITVSGASNPLVRTVNLTYDSDGVYPVTFTDPLGFTSVSLSHPAFGLPILEVDVNGNTSTAKYDGFGRPLSSIEPGSAPVVTTYASVSSGNRRGLKAVTAIQSGTLVGDYSITQVTTDELGRTIQKGSNGFSGAWTYTDVEYDHFDNVARESIPTITLPSTQYSTFTYDRLGRRVRAVTPSGATTNTTYSMFRTNTIDPEWHESFVEYDRSMRVARSGNFLDGAEYGDVMFAYGAFDQAEIVTNAAGNKTHRSYDALGRMWEIDDPDAGVTQYEYDGFGEVLEEVRADGEVITYGYDTAGRQTYSSGDEGNTTFTYDVGTGAKHRLTSATSFDGVTTTSTFDPLGRPLQTSQSIDGVTRSVSRRYDAYGRLRHLLYPAVTGYSRFVVQYEYGTGGFLQQIRDVTACNVSPDPNVPVGSCPTASNPSLWQVLARNERMSLTQAKFGNNLTDTREYFSQTGRLKKITAAGIVTNYDYFSNGNLKKRWEGSRIEDFEYDALERLTKWTLTPSGRSPQFFVTTYGYSELGNLESVTKDGTLTFSGTFGAGGRPNALLQAPPLGSFTYDALGRQETGAGRSVGWTRLDKPAFITEGATTTFRYDAFEQRVVKQSPSKKTIYFDKLYEHREAGTSVSDVFLVHGEPGVVAQVEYANFAPPNKRYLVGDGLASVTVTMNGTTTISPREYFDPFGRRVNVDGIAMADPDPKTTVGFTGQEEDDANLVNMNGRIYDRKQYRFLSPDPVISAPLFGQSHNPYSYVVNNPLRYNDPSGYTLEQADGAAGGEFTGYDDIEDGGNGDGAGSSTEPTQSPVTDSGVASDGTGGNTQPINDVTPSDTGMGEYNGAGSPIASTTEFGGPPPPEYQPPGPNSWFADMLLGLLGNHDSALESAQDFSAGVGIGALSIATGAWIGEVAMAAGWGYIGSGMAGGAVGGLVGAQGEVAYEEGRLLTPGEAVDASAEGAVIGGAFGVLGKITSGCKCFPAGTLVQTDTGMVPIEDLREGDLVLSRDPDTGEIAARPILNLTVRSTTELVTVELIADDGAVTKVQATPEHPFWTAGGWVDVDKLHPGDQVFSLDSGWLRVGAATWAQTDVLVYNFEVTDFHTYFVGEFGAWVHNTCCTKMPKAKPKATPGGEPGARPGLDFTEAGKREVWRQNKAKNGGRAKCEMCGKRVIRPKQHKSGVRPPKNEGHVDHIDPRSKGGSGTVDNGQLGCRRCNLEKSDK